MKVEWSAYLINLLKLKPLLCLVIFFISATCIADHEKITLLTEHLPPYQIVDSGKITGFAVDIVKEVAIRSGYHYELSAYSWMRSYNLTQRKKNHCIFSIARIPSRENLFRWVGTITEVNNAVIWGLKERDAVAVNNIGELRDSLIAVNRNDVTHLGLLERGFKEGENLYVLDNTDSLVNLLVTRPEVDFIVADDITIGYRAHMASVDTQRLQRVFEIKGLELNFYLACGNDTDDTVIDKLSKSLEQVHTDGFYRKTLARWKSSMLHIR